MPNYLENFLFKIEIFIFLPSKMTQLLELFGMT